MSDDDISKIVICGGCEAIKTKIKNPDETKLKRNYYQFEDQTNINDKEDLKSTAENKIAYISVFTDQLSHLRRTNSMHTGGLNKWF